MRKEREAALIAGISLVVMAIAAGVSYGYVYGNLIIENNPKQTLENIANSLTLFNIGVFGWVVIFITDILVTIYLFSFFRASNRRGSFLISISRLIYTIILGIAVFSLVKISVIVGGESFFPDSENEIMVVELLKSFETIWSNGLIVFGFHLIFIGYAIIKYKVAHLIFGILLILAGASYIFVHGGYMLFPAYELIVSNIEKVLQIPMGLGEMIFAVWLIIKGGKR